MKKGISLYELIIVMAIISIVTAITIPTLNSYLPSLKLSSSARAVSNKLREAQEEAVTTQVQHGIKLNPASSPPTIEFIKVTNNTVNPYIYSTSETVTLANNITLTNISSSITSNPHGPNTIFFSADGGPDVNGNIQVNLDTAFKTITVSAAGVIKLQ